MARKALFFARSPFFLLGTFVSLFTQDTFANPGCPNEQLSVWARNTTTLTSNTTDATKDLSIAGAFGTTAFGQYDLMAGVLRGHVHDHGNFTMNLADQYTITGLPVGTPLVIQALYHIRALAASSPGTDRYAELSAQILDTPSNQRSLFVHAGARFPPFAVQVDTTLSLPLSVTVGQAFVLHLQFSGEAEWFNVNVAADTPAQPGASLSFAGLPQGSILTSCQGFRIEAPIAVEPTTWSRIKSLYASD